MSSNDAKSLQEKPPGRQSLPVIKTPNQHHHQSLRHTQSHTGERKPKKKVKTLVPAPIPEEKTLEDSPKNTITKHEREQIRLSIISEGKESRSSRAGSRKGSNASSVRDHLSYDNAAFEGTRDGNANISYSNSNTNSLRSSRNPSVQSLNVIREQYCCCARWTPCERILVASVAVLAAIIIILVIVISFLARKDNSQAFDQEFSLKL